MSYQKHRTVHWKITISTKTKHKSWMLSNFCIKNFQRKFFSSSLNQSLLGNGSVVLWKTSVKSLEPILRSGNNEFLLANFRSTFLFYISWKHKKQCFYTCYKNTRFSYPWHIAKLQKNYTREFLKKLMFWVISNVIVAWTPQLWFKNRQM